MQSQKGVENVGFGLFYIPVLHDGLTATQVYDALISQACAADDLGWDNVWFAEHHFDAFGGIIPSPALFATAVAMRTQHLRVGAAVTVLPLHHAVRVAEEFAMLDVLSGGRVDLGIGRGFSRHEFQALGLSMESREGRFAEGVTVLLDAWAHERFSFQGEYYALHEVEMLPRPLQRPHPPIWVAASSNRASFELAGRFGFNLMLNPYSRTVDEVRRGLDWYREALAGSAHEIGSKRIMVNYHLYAARDERAAREEPRDALLYYLSEVDRNYLKGAEPGQTAPQQASYDSMYPARVMFGTPDAIEAKIRAWMRFGVTDFCFMSLFGNLDPDLSLASIQLFSEEVMPRFPKDDRRVVTPETERI